MENTNPIDIAKILLPLEKVENITQLHDDKLSKIYEVYVVKTNQNKFILKRNNDSDELITYQTLLMNQNFQVPKLLNYHMENNKTWLLFDYVGDHDIRGFHYNELTSKVAKAISEIHLKFKDSQRRTMKYYIDIAKIIPSDYRLLYGQFLKRISSCPWTLIHNDFLPINVIATDNSVKIIDWEPKYGPYMLDIARLLCHRDNRHQKYLPEDFIQGFIDDYYILTMNAYQMTFERYKTDILYGFSFEYIQVLKHYWKKDLCDETYHVYYNDLSNIWKQIQLVTNIPQ